jgi:hypothetical protein
VQFCCQRLLVIEADFAKAFHRELRELMPGCSHPASPPDRGLSGALAHCLLWAALTRDPPDVVENTVRAFATDHHARGFPDAAYASLAHALLRSVREALPLGWSSEVSSGWVSYALWLQPHLEFGACSTPHPADRPGDTSVASLDVILQRLRSQYFPGQDRALNAICTRVMLRTGADLRAPLPEQRTDPQVIADVLESLLLMGFTPAPDTVALPFGPGSNPDAAPGPGQIDSGSARDRPRPMPVQGPDTGRRRRWIPHRRRRNSPDQAGQRPSLP